MKKDLFLFMLALICFCNLKAQNTTLNIDNQTPGWLSSHISPNDIATLQNLTVSGIVNDVDLKIIGSLVKNYKLQGTLDLSNVTIVGDKLSGDMFGVTDCDLKHFLLPKAVSEMVNVLSWVSVDTLTACGEMCPKFNVIDYSDSYANMKIKHLILREGTTYFCYKREYSTDDKNTTLTNIRFPESVSILNLRNFYAIENLNIPSNVKSLMQSEISFNSDTLFVPSSVETFYTSWAKMDGYNGEGGRIRCLYLDKNIETIWLSGINYEAIIDIHIKAKNPPKIENTSSISLQKCIVYVPVGTKTVYENARTWKNANIIEEVYAQSISIDAPSIVYLGESHNFNVEFYPSNTTFKDVHWGSEDSSVLKFSDTGIAIPQKVGKATISATNSDKSCIASKEICVYMHATDISISNTSLQLKIGKKEQLTAQTLPFGTSDGQITWSSSDDAIATVDENGNVKGITKGTCTITATSVDGGYTKECVVTVVQPVQGIQLEKHETNLKVGESEELRVQITPNDANNKNIKWASEDESIATVNNEGVVTGVKSGKVRIYATSEENSEIYDYCTITITQPVTGVTIDKQIIELTSIGETIQLQATVLPEDAENKKVKWSSSNETVCKVSEDGIVTAIEAGNATITASTEDGNFVAHCSVTIALKIKGVTLEKHELTLKVGESENLRVQITPNNANNKNIKWVSEDESIATVNNEGVVVGVKSGKVRIYATSEENSEIYDYCTVTVTQPVVGITLDKQTVELTSIGESVQLQATVLPEDAENQNVRWSSSNEKVCIVSSNGTVVGLNDGLAIIIATTEDGGFLATCQVTVNTSSHIDGVIDDPNMLIVEGNTIFIKNKSANDMVSIYSSVGKVIYEGYDDVIKLASGIYIVKIGNNYKKIAL